MCRIGEHTLRHAAVIVILVKEELVLLGIGCCRYYQEVKVVEDCLLLQFPVRVVEVVVNPHEPLVNHFRYDRLLRGSKG